MKSEILYCVGGQEEHGRIVLDHFAKDGLGRRLIPGDCLCLACKQPLPVWWNKGKPVPCEPQSPSVRRGARIKS